ncbi:hypothetical protein QUA44_28020 [Microcoleus sp. N9_A2]|uniref:hypothetical protein n=1 Tax=Microcoleus sp. N9_B1 TaxID=3055384 RepID=UPI002FCF44B1
MLINAQYFDYAVTERLVLSVATRPGRFARSASPNGSKSKGSTSALFPIPHFPFPIPQQTDVIAH